MNIARKALEVLDRDGWIKYEAHGPNGHCSVGALETAREEIFESVTQKEKGALWDQYYLIDSLLENIVREQYPERLYSKKGLCDVAAFNDHIRTTFDDVRTVFEKTAVKFEEQA